MDDTEVNMSQIAFHDRLLMESAEYATEQSVTPEQIIDKLVSQFLYQMSLKKMGSRNRSVSGDARCISLQLLWGICCYP